MQTRTRMTTLTTVAAVTIAVTLAASAQAGDLRAELDTLVAKIDQALMDGDIDAIMSFYADDAVMMPNFAEKLEGKQAIRENLLASREEGLVFESFTGQVDEAWECGDMVYEVGTYAAAITLPGVERPIGDKGKIMTVWRREQGGKLKIVYEIWNTDIEPGK